MLQKRPVRSLSGIVNISILTKPFPCPGKCIFCPREKGIPASYLSGEPAVERAKRLSFNPYLQVKKRVEMLKREGHSTEKIEMRIVGGTWSYYPKKYQEWFVKRAFDACNKSPSSSLKEAERKNEKAKERIVTLSVETRPDFINKEEIVQLRKLGVTKVELGVQTLNDKVLAINKRGHGVKEIIRATKLLKDHGFKVSYQMMLNLLGMRPKEEVRVFGRLFWQEDFRPDALKIYPCALLKETPLYQYYLRGEYKPYNKETLIKTLKEIKKLIPYYVRIERIIRDIPANKVIKGGVKISNLRELVKKEMAKEGASCHCIRCREVREDYKKGEKIFLFRENYTASQGKEVFLSFENKKRTKLYSLLRLRLPSQGKPFFKVLEKSALIRELHTYGQALPISQKRKGENSPQNKGLARRLIRESEKIAKEEFGFKKIAVIAGIGAREYFRKLGYKLRETYMGKNL